MEPDFGKYKKLVANIKNFVTELNPITVACKCEFAADVNPNPKKWVAKDLVNLATNQYGYSYFESLAVLSVQSDKKDAKGAYTADAICAQNALKEFTPEGISQETYNIWISTVYTKTKTVRAELAANMKKIIEKQKGSDKAEQKKESLQSSEKSSSLIEHQLFDKVTENRTALAAVTDVKPAFNQQEALATLEAHKVTLASDQSLQTPAVDRALEFVKAAKGRAA